VDFASLLQANQLRDQLVMLFIPSVDRDNNPIDQNHWIDAALEVLGTRLGGATAYPKARGVWRDDERGGILIYDEPVLIQCYTTDAKLIEHGSHLRDFLVKMGTETKQGSVGIAYNQRFFEIRFSHL
jgi:hypothetical protein